MFMSVFCLCYLYFNIKVKICPVNKSVECTHIIKTFAEQIFLQTQKTTFFTAMFTCKQCFFLSFCCSLLCFLAHYGHVPISGHQNPFQQMIYLWQPASISTLTKHIDLLFLEYEMRKFIRVHLQSSDCTCLRSLLITDLSVNTSPLPSLQTPNQKIIISRKGTCFPSREDGW